MAMTVDRHKVHSLMNSPLLTGAADVLRRQGTVFFVGGNLPMYETLETMFESHCMESTGLFYLTFGNSSTLQDSLEMARMIKKNFHVRLMGRLDSPASAEILERIYAAGVDILDIPLRARNAVSTEESEPDQDARLATLNAARSIFSRWSVVSSLVAGQESADTTIATIDTLLENGIIPLVSLSEQAAGQEPEYAVTIFSHVAAEWKRRQVPIKTLLPLISLTTPLTSREQPGFVRGFIDKIRDRQQLASSDLQRHLRIGHAQDSLDSAGL